MITAALEASGCFIIQVSLWGLRKMVHSGQAVIRLSLWSLRVAPCLPAPTENRAGGLMQKETEPGSVDFQGPRALLSCNSAVLSACKRQTVERTPFFGKPSSQPVLCAREVCR